MSLITSQSVRLERDDIVHAHRNMRRPCMSDYKMQKEFLVWFNRSPIQFFQDKDSHTLVAIYLGYYRCGTGWDDLTIKGHLKQDEMLGTPSGTISSQAESGMVQKVQRLEAETRNVSNASTSLLPRNRIKEFLDDIVWTAKQFAEVSDKELAR